MNLGLTLTQLSIKAVETELPRRWSLVAPTVPTPNQVTKNLQTMGVTVTTSVYTHNDF